MRLACLSAAVVVLTAFTDLAHGRIRSLQELRQENVVMQRWDNSCGAASLATVLTFRHGHAVSEEEIARGMLRQTDPLRVRHRGGFSLLDMKRQANALGFEAEGYSELTIHELAGMPWAIVPLRMRGYDHFVVVREISGDQVAVADPSFGNYTLPLARFMAAWQGKIAFEVEPKR
jgi:predicted double-glycine peptidase